MNNPNLLQPCVRPDSTTIYSLIASDLGTGCTSEMTTVDTLSSIVVNVYPLPIANAGPDIDMCLLDSITLHGTGSGAGPAYAFEWSPSTGLNDPTWPSPHASPSFTTWYILTVWSNGCPSYGDTMFMYVHTNPTVDAGPNLDICYGQTVGLHAIAGGDPNATYAFEWFPPNGLNNAFTGSPLATPQVTTKYYVKSVTNWGCVAHLILLW
jgi:hypothetical protein